MPLTAATVAGQRGQRLVNAGQRWSKSVNGDLDGEFRRTLPGPISDVPNLLAVSDLRYGVRKTMNGDFKVRDLKIQRLISRRLGSTNSPNVVERFR